MSMPQDLYYALNRAFEAARDAEKEAARLEHEAQAVRDRAMREVQDLYNLLNRSTITLPKEGDR